MPASKRQLVGGWFSQTLDPDCYWLYVLLALYLPTDLSNPDSAV